jgi:hypothetical protein
MPLVVTHDHLRLLLPRYAAGVLSTGDAEAIRAHLADGCGECLDALYRMPVGMPRDVRPGAYGRSRNGGPPFASERIPAPVGPASGAAPSWLPRALALAITAGAIAWALSAWGALPA